MLNTVVDTDARCKMLSRNPQPRWTPASLISTSPGRLRFHLNTLLQNFSNLERLSSVPSIGSAFDDESIFLNQNGMAPSNIRNNLIITITASMVIKKDLVFIGNGITACGMEK